MMKHYIASIVILALVTAGHLGISRSKADAARKNPAQVVIDIPSQFGGYVQFGDDTEVGEDVERMLETSTILMRGYRAPSGWPIDLTIVYAGVTRRSLHFPEVCFVGQGWEIEQQTSMQVGFLFRATKLVIVRGNRRDAVLYWFKTGDHLTGSFFVNSWQWTKQMITAGTATSAMVRISAPIAQRPDEDVFSELEQFAIQFVPVLMENIN